MRTFVLHDESVNTYGFRMLTAGGNLDELRKNPVILLNHNDYGLPIGRWENIRVEGTKILAEPVFDLKDVIGRQVNDKVDDDFVRAASIGAWPPEEISDDPLLKLPGQTGPTVVKWTAREASIVTIGSNHNSLALYDRVSGKRIDLSNSDSVIKLFDTQKQTIIKRKMKSLLTLLNLADNASEADAAAALRNVISDRERIKSENITLASRIDELTKEAKEKKKSMAVALVDAAVKDGILDAKAKESTLKLFDADFDAAKTMLEGLPKRQSVTEQIAASAGQSATALADLQKASWEDLDRTGKLVELKDKYPDLYVEKFEKRFGCKPRS